MFGRKNYKKLYLEMLSKEAGYWGQIARLKNEIMANKNIIRDIKEGFIDVESITFDGDDKNNPDIHFKYKDNLISDLYSQKSEG